MDSTEAGRVIQQSESLGLGLMHLVFQGFGFTRVAASFVLCNPKEAF